MLEISIKFSLENIRLSDEALEYWTYIESEGYKFFLEKTKDLLQHLQKGDFFEFQAYCSHPNRDIIKDFDDARFQLVEKTGIVSPTGKTRLIYVIKPAKF